MLDSLLTEQRNPLSDNLDLLDTRQLIELINNEDQRVPLVVREEIEAIVQAVDGIVGRLRAGGRLIYFGAGTSGRLGVLDASEMPPTYSVSRSLVRGMIAGGRRALTRSVEGAEDDPAAGERDAIKIKVSAKDAVVGLAASGRTPYVIGALDYARRVGALTIAVACTRPAEIAEHADLAILPLVGPEVVTGSTRMKAGTAQKLVLNLLSTATMVRLGKTYGNLMVDLRPTNVKLRARAVRILRLVTGVDDDRAKLLLQESGWQVKTAILMQLSGISAAKARRRLKAAGGVIRRALPGLPPGQG